MDKWETQLQKDREADIHSPELYIIWALKQEFVKKAIQRNPYDSTHFVWCDIGCFRSPENIEKPLRFAEAAPALTLPNKITILNIEDRHIGGGVLAGDIPAWSHFTTTYLDTLKHFETIGRFYGKDQDVYTYMINTNPNAFHIVKAILWGAKKYDAGKVDTQWFYLTAYLGGYL